VILTGMIEELRQQTQERLDWASSAAKAIILLRGDKNRQPIGVGRFRDEVRPNVLTSWIRTS